MKPLDAYAIHVATGVPTSTIRTWAMRGKLTACGADSQGRTLYDLDAVVDVIAATGWMSAAERLAARGVDE